MQKKLHVSAGDANLQSQITAEVTRATGIEAGLRTDVDANTQGVADNASAISVETARALAVEAVNAQAIADETTRAQPAEAVNAQAIVDETTRVTGVEAGLRTDVDANAASIAGLDSDMSAEEAARIVGDASSYNHN